MTTALAKALPRKLKIGPYPYTLEFAEGWVKMKGDDGNKWGLCDHAAHKIVITGPEIFPNKTMLVSVVVHEVLHGVWTAQSLPNKVKEEEAVASLEVGLVQLFQDNPGFLDWIKKGLK